MDIVPGSALARVAGQLEHEGVVTDALLFRLLGRLDGLGARVRAGEFALHTGWTPRQVLRALTEGQTVLHKLVLPEGLTWWQAGAWSSNPGWPASRASSARCMTRPARRVQHPRPQCRRIPLPPKPISCPAEGRRRRAHRGRHASRRSGPRPGPAVARRPAPGGRSAPAGESGGHGGEGNGPARGTCAGGRGLRQPHPPGHAHAVRPHGNLRPGAGLQRQPDPGRPPGRGQPLQHLPPQGPAPGADLLPGPGGPAGGPKPRKTHPALLRGPTRRQPRLQPQPGRTQRAVREHQLRRR